MRLLGCTLALILVSFTFTTQAADERTICGNDDMENMVSLDDNMKSMGMPVGILNTGSGSCTGTLVSKDLFFTAGHCKAACKDLVVTFGYLKGRTEKFGCREVVEADDSSMNRDYMLVRLEGSPGVVWGWYDMADATPSPKTNLLIIHHPEGLPMKVSRRNCQVQKISGGLLYHSCDTNPGTSGSAIIVPDYDKPENSRVVAVHAYGGCNAASTEFNSGATIKNLTTLSPVIKSMVK